MKAFYRRWIFILKMTRGILLVFLYTIMISISVFADDTGVSCRDLNGNEIDCENRFYDTQNSVEFLINSTGLKDDEIIGLYLFNKGLAEDIDIAQEDLIKLPQNCYVLSPQGMDEYLIAKFFVINTTKNSIESFNDIEYKIHFTKSNLGLLADFNCVINKEVDGVIYTKISPTLHVKPSEVAATRIYIDNGVDKKLIDVTKEERLSFSEGEYLVSLVNADDSGKEYMVEGFPKHFIYDATPPEDGKILVTGKHSSLTRGNEEIIYARAVKIACSLVDELSGMEEILLSDGQEEKRVKEIELDKDGEYSISFVGKDKCGNKTSSFYMDESVVIDTKYPNIECRQVNESGEIILKLTDNERLLSFKLYAGEELLREERYDGREIDSKELAISVDRNLKAIVTDAALNSVALDITATAGSTMPKVCIKGISDGQVINTGARAYIDVYDKDVLLEDLAVSLLYRDDAGREEEKNLGSINELNLTKEGTYQISVNARDKEGNLYNDIKSLTIDKSAPVICGLDLLDGKYLDSLNLKDKMADMIQDKNLSKLRIYLNGEEYDYDKEIKDRGHYVLSIYALDKAGNVATDQAEFVINDAVFLDKNSDKEQKPSISENRIEADKTEEIINLTIADEGKKTSNFHLLLALSGVGVCAILIIIFICIWRKRWIEENQRKSESEM